MENETFTISPEERIGVWERYPKIEFPDPIMEPVWYGRHDHVRIQDKWAIVDQNKGTAFAVCSIDYKIIRYENIIFMVEKIVEELTGEYGRIQVYPRLLKDGGRLQVTLKFPDHPSLIRELDSIVPKVEVFSSYDLSSKLMGRFGAFQLKCTNGMGVWKSFRAFAKRHLQNLFLNDLGETISAGLLVFGEQVENWKKWTGIKIPQRLYDKMWDALPFSPAEKEKIENLPEIGTNLLLPDALKSKELTVWDLNSVLTQFATHQVKSEVRRIELEPEIAKNMEEIAFLALAATTRKH